MDIPHVNNVPTVSYFPHTAICICTEQTFTEASADDKAFGPAFSAALKIYLGSSVQEKVNREIAALLETDFLSKRTIIKEVVPIITSNRLRMWLSLIEYSDGVSCSHFPGIQPHTASAVRNDGMAQKVLGTLHIVSP